LRWFTKKETDIGITARIVYATERARRTRHEFHEFS
jgi:hypothetical protein